MATFHQRDLEFSVDGCVCPPFFFRLALEFTEKHAHNLILKLSYA